MKFLTDSGGWVGVQGGGGGRGGGVGGCCCCCHCCSSSCCMLHAAACCATFSRPPLLSLAPPSANPPRFPPRRRARLQSWPCAAPRPPSPWTASPCPCGAALPSSGARWSRLGPPRAAPARMWLWRAALTCQASSFESGGGPRIVLLCNVHVCNVRQPYEQVACWRPFAAVACRTNTPSLASPCPALQSTWAASRPSPAAPWAATRAARCAPETCSSWRPPTPPGTVAQAGRRCNGRRHGWGCASLPRRLQAANQGGGHSLLRQATIVSPP